MKKNDSGEAEGKVKKNDSVKQPRVASRVCLPDRHAAFTDPTPSTYSLRSARGTLKVEKWADLLHDDLPGVLKAAQLAWKPLSWDAAQLYWSFTSLCMWLAPQIDVGPKGHAGGEYSPYVVASGVQGNLVKCWRETHPKWSGGKKCKNRKELVPLREHFRLPAQGENIHKAVSDDLGKFLTARGLLNTYLHPLHEEHDEYFGHHLVAMYKGSGIQGDVKQHKETKTSLLDLMGGSLQAEKETQPEYVMHGTWMYALPCICATGEVLQSDTEAKGHEFQKAPGAYATCCRDVAIQYARPFRPNNGRNDTWQIVLVFRVMRRHSAWLKGQKGQYVYGPNSLRLSRVLFIPNRPDLWCNPTEVVVTYHPLLEASPFRLSWRLENLGEGARGDKHASSDADDVPLRRHRNSSVARGIDSELHRAVINVASRMWKNKRESKKALLWAWAFIEMQQLIDLNSIGMYYGEAGFLAQYLYENVPKQFLAAVKSVYLRPQKGLPELCWRDVICSIPPQRWGDGPSYVRAQIEGQDIDLRRHGNMMRALFSKIAFEGTKEFVLEGAAEEGLSPNDFCAYINHACSELRYSTRAIPGSRSIRIQAGHENVVFRHGRQHYHHSQDDHVAFVRTKIS